MSTDDDSWVSEHEAVVEKPEVSFNSVSDTYTIKVKLSPSEAEQLSAEEARELGFTESGSSSYIVQSASDPYVANTILAMMKGLKQ
jgi:hypothetical protein